MAPILHSRLPQDMAAPRALPGTAPLDMAGWPVVDEAYAAQMAERARLIAARREDVHALLPAARPAAEELLALVVAQLAARPELGFAGDGSGLRCPDGRQVVPDPGAPLITLGHLLQEDLCILQKRGDSHVLTGAILCFPASWTLAEKIGRPLRRIHDPVASYDDNIARRVQRMFDGLRAGRPLWRSNLLRFADPALYQPRPEAHPRPPPDRGQAGYLRAERQSLLRLPETGAVVFSIHTYVVATPDGAAP